MFAKTADGKLVQIRAFGEDGELHDLAQSADAAAEGPKQSARILRQLNEGRYLGRFSTNPSQDCAIDIPGPMRADGDSVGGRFERVGVLKLNGRNLAHYRWLGEGNANPVAAPDSQADLQAADIQSVYDAFRKGEITFVLPGVIAQPCLACKGTGRQYDEEAIEKRPRPTSGAPTIGRATIRQRKVMRSSTTKPRRVPSSPQNFARIAAAIAKSRQRFSSNTPTLDCG